ncbi:MAG: dTMP kinase [Oscillospiraceae bacterium]|jgi:dTMP kinase|nr:dTMP kinase [Oscillospiraceae bacterium]
MGKKGIFIAFEGLDGSGKTTQLQALRDYMLNEKNTKCKEECEPSDGLLGIMARGAVKKKIYFEPQTMALLFAADRYEHVTNDIKPYIDKGFHVLSDRYVLSNFAYQGMTCDFETIYNYNKAAMDLLMPDLTVLIDAAPEKSMERIEETRLKKELFDDDGGAISPNYLSAIEWLAKKGLVEIIGGCSPAGDNGVPKVLIVDGNRHEAAVSREIISYAEPLLFSS